MFKLLIIFLVLVIGFFVGPLLQGQQGSAIIEVAHYKISMSFTVFVFCLAIFYLLIAFIAWIIKNICNSSRIFGNWFSFKASKRSIKQLEHGQFLLLEGDYAKASKFFIKSLKGSQNATLAYLLAAYAQLENNQLINAKYTIEEAARICKPNEAFALQILQIRLLIKNKQYDKARQIIDRLLTKKSRNPEVLKLANEIYFTVGDYEAVIDILPDMAKQQIYSDSLLNKYQQSAYIERIKQLVIDGDQTKLHSWWKKQPRAIRNNIVYKQAMAKYLPNSSK